MDVTRELVARGVDAVSAQSLGYLGDSDREHLLRAIEQSRVLCTYDTDFIVLAGEILDHMGIIYAHSDQTRIGHWVRNLERLRKEETSESFAGRLYYLPLR